MGLTGPLAEYYAARAGAYEDVYAKPERQHDLARLRELVPEYFRGRNVLEIACGTGYWTELVAQTAASVVATDIAPETLAIARVKPIPPDRVRFQIADVFALDDVPGDFDAALGGFWWSHVRRDDLRRFLAGLHRRLSPGARVLFLDNRYVEGSSHPIARTDSDGNTFQRRKVSNGTVYEVLKNFPTAADLRHEIELAGGTAIQILELQYYWLVAYDIARV